MELGQRCEHCLIQAYCDKFYNRTMDLINKYQPDLIYFDDTALPLWPVSDAGLKIAAHFYNSNNQWHGAKDDGVLFGKILDADQQQCMAWDIERGVNPTILPHPWQTDTCIGGWHYDRGLYDRNDYKSTKTVIQMLADIVSKNGNLLLNIPVRGDGTIDEKELKVVEGIANWMDVNKECIFGTRPWKVFGEGPASAGAALSAQGFNEGKGKPFYGRRRALHAIKRRPDALCHRAGRADEWCEHHLAGQKCEAAGQSHQEDSTAGQTRKTSNGS